MGLTDDRNDPRLRNIEPNGMQEAYLVLSEEELAKGFVRPVRTRYTHLACGTTTWMAELLAETYARKPTFYTHTWCGACRDHLPVGPDGEFVWEGTDEKVGT